MIPDKNCPVPPKNNKTPIIRFGVAMSRAWRLTVAIRKIPTSINVKILGIRLKWPKPQGMEVIPVAKENSPRGEGFPIPKGLAEVGFAWPSTSYADGYRVSTWLAADPGECSFWGWFKSAAMTKTISLKQVNININQNSE
jgi:hypothetical protein